MSIADDIARVKYYRNTVYGHASQASVDDSSFSACWQEIREALVRLGGAHFRAKIDNLEHDCMDPVIEEHYRELMKQWKKDDDSIKDKLEEIEDSLDKIEIEMKEVKEKLSSLTASAEKSTQEDTTKLSLEKLIGEIAKMDSELKKVKEKMCTSTAPVAENKDEACQHDTPTHQWNLPSLPKEFSLFIKRDDMTGSTLSGNKTTDIGCEGNLFLNKLVGSQIIVVPQLQYKSGLKQMMEKVSEKLKEQGSSAYLIEVGGSSYMGMFGYLTAFQEMIDQNVLKNFDDIVVTVGSGGSASGIAIGNYLTGSKLKCHAVNVCDDAAYFYQKINEDLQIGGLDVQAEELIDIIDGYKGQGYGKSTEEELEDIVEISRTTGIMVDPVYNVKAIRGMLHEMNTNPGRFKGHRILYIHTGGVFGLYDGRMDPLVTRPALGINDVVCWESANDPMPF